MTTSAEVWRRVLPMAVAGGMGFWVANLAISLTPIAAEYRAALSIPYVPMLFEALLGGLVIALGVSWILVRHPGVLPPGRRLAKSLYASAIALIAVTVAIEIPSKFIANPAGSLRYFLVGAAFNAVRILVLGLVIGTLGQARAGQDRGRRGHQPGTVLR